jgi:hypothetical protein
MCGKLILCFALVLSMTSATYARDYLIGTWEGNSNGWIDWGGSKPPIDDSTLMPSKYEYENTVWSSAGDYCLKVTQSGWNQNLAIRSYESSYSGFVSEFLSHDKLSIDLYYNGAEWPAGSWAQIYALYIQGTGVNWVEYTMGESNETDTGNPTSQGQWDNGNFPGIYTTTISWDYSAERDAMVAAGLTPSNGYVNFIFCTNTNNAGSFRFDNVRFVKTPQPAAITIKKCTVMAGKTQGADSNDISNIKDVFTASGTFSDFSPDLNNITDFNVSLYSVGEDANVLAYNEANNFDVCDVNHGKFKYTHKIPKGGAGAITSLTLDFNKLTFAITTKNIDLTSLACPLELEIALGDYIPSGEANEAIVNGKSKTIPTRLQRMYKDTLIVTPGKAKVKNSTKASSDSLSVKGQIAVEDINATDPNLYALPVVISWSSADDTNSQTFTIPAHSFKIPKTGHLYKLNRNITPTVAPVAEPNSKVSGTIDLDKCTFALSITKADINAVSGQAKFGISFDTPHGEFDEVNDVNLAWKR